MSGGLITIEGWKVWIKPVNGSLEIERIKRGIFFKKIWAKIKEIIWLNLVLNEIKFYDDLTDKSLFLKSNYINWEVLMVSQC